MRVFKTKGRIGKKKHRKLSNNYKKHHQNLLRRLKIENISQNNKQTISTDKSSIFQLSLLKKNNILEHLKIIAHENDSLNEDAANSQDHYHHFQTKPFVFLIHQQAMKELFFKTLSLMSYIY